MGRIIAISSGDLDTTKPINEYAVKMIKSATRNVLFIGTASRDAEGYAEVIEKEFKAWDCSVKVLSLTAKKYTDKEISEMISWADIIYVGGGDTIFMMNTWKKYDLDKKLRDVYEKDSAILMGISAGAICWFNCGCTDSELAVLNEGFEYGWANDMLNIHNYAFCPHYEDRVEVFSALLEEKTITGLAMECNTAFVDENGQLYCIKSDEMKKAYWLRYRDGKVEKEEVSLKLV